MNKKNIFGLLCMVALLLVFGCDSSPKTVKRMQMLEEGVSAPSTIEELKDGIAKYEKRATDLVSAQAQIGIWYKILATRYIDKQMYGEALKSLQMAVQFYPANQNLYYYIGVCAGYMAKSSLDYDAVGSKTAQQNYLMLAESGYKRAIELEPRYSRALYGLAVLYVFELNQPAKAVPLLDTVLTVEPKHSDAMMLLARAYYMTYDFDAAVAMYDRIIQTSGSDIRKAEAEANKKVVLDAAYK